MTLATAALLLERSPTASSVSSADFASFQRLGSLVPGGTCRSSTAARPVTVGMQVELVASAEIVEHAALEVWQCVAALVGSVDNLRSTQT